MNQGNRTDQIHSALMLTAGLIFYLFFALYDGVVIAVDSESYINMEVTREPVYPMLLAAARTIFSFAGESFYLQVTVLLQSVLAAFAAWMPARYLKSRLNLPWSLAWILWALPLAVSLLCRFAAGRASMYSNSILTEGICIPLYLIFFRYLLEYCLDHTRRSTIWCLVLSFILYSTRKQMVIALALWMLCTLILSASGRGLRRSLLGLLSALCGAVLVLGANRVLDLGYNYVVRGEAITHTSDTRFLTTMAFYTADREDAQYIEEEEIRELFLEIYDICEEAGYLMDSAGDGWLSRVSHFGDHYDNIQIDTMWPIICRYAEETLEDAEGNITSAELNAGADEIMNVINAAVLPHNAGRLVRCCADNFLSGLVTTVAQRKPVLIQYSAFVYILYGVMLMACILTARRSGPFGKKSTATDLRNGEELRTDGTAPARAPERMRNHDSENNNAAPPADDMFPPCAEIALTASLTALSIVVNVGLVSLVIFAQTRYTVYNMPLFYASLLLMGYALHITRHSRVRTPV